MRLQPGCSRSRSLHHRQFALFAGELQSNPDYRCVGPPTGGHAEAGRLPEEEERVNSYPRREFLLRALAACGTPFLMPLASVEGLQKPQAGTAAAGYFGGRTDAARAIGRVPTYGNWGSTRARSRFARRRWRRSRSSNGPQVSRMPSGRWVLPCVVTSSRDDRDCRTGGLGFFHVQESGALRPHPAFRRRTDLNEACPGRHLHRRPATAATQSSRSLKSVQGPHFRSPPTRGRRCTRPTALAGGLAINAFCSP